MVFALRSKILEGHTLASGLSDFPKIFPELYRATVSAGESSGHLDIVLDRLADYTESRQQMSQKIAQATIYPAILTVMAFLVVTGLLMFVVPQIVEVFDSSGQKLPGITRMDDLDQRVLTKLVVVIINAGSSPVFWHQAITVYSRQ